MKSLLFVILALLGSSCATRQRSPERTDYTLTNANGIILSNLHANPEGVRKENNEVKFNYNVIVKNISDSPLPVDLSGAFLLIDKEPKEIFCTNYRDQQAVFTLEPQNTIKIICRASIEAKERYKHRDHNLKINIPIGDTLAQYTYEIWTEDFK